MHKSVSVCTWEGGGVVNGMGRTLAASSLVQACEKSLKSLQSR